MTIRGILLDLDGTVYRGADQVPGAARFVAVVERMGIRCLFVTNRANRTPGEIREHLQGYGIACGADDIVTSAQAAAAYLPVPSAVYALGEDGLRAALEERGHAVRDHDVDYVVVGFDRGFTYDKLVRACNLIHAGATFVATNPDRALRVENGILPGTGAIVAAVAAGSDRQPVMIGKPEPLIFEMAARRLGLAPADIVAVGDSLETDVPAGQRAGMRTVLMLTGVSRREDLARAPVQPTWVADGFAELETWVRMQI